MDSSSVNMDEGSESIVGMESFENLSKEIVQDLLSEHGSKSITEETSLTGYGNVLNNFPGIYSLPVSPPKNDFVSLQKWEGIVEEVYEDSFEARLIDLTSNTPDEVAEIPLEEVSKDDYPLIEEGAIFYWNIGYRDKVSGQRERVTFIRFRRLPMWQKRELKVAERNAEEIQELLR
jgi:hypothetical protein